MVMMRRFQMMKSQMKKNELSSCIIGTLNIIYSVLLITILFLTSVNPCKRIHGTLIFLDFVWRD